MRGIKRAPQASERVEGQRFIEHGRQRAQNRPVFARIARREGGAFRHLHAAFGVDVEAGFFRIGGARQDDVGAVRAAIAMGADIHDEGARRHLHLVDAEQEQHVKRALAEHGAGIHTALARHEADIERAHQRRFSVQNIEAVPAVLDDAERGRRFRDHRQHRRAVRPIQRALADDEHRLFFFRRRVFDKLRQTLRPGAEVIIVISKVGLLADQAEQHIALEETLADAGVEHGCFAPRIDADQHDGVGVVDAGDGRIEQIAGAAEYRM